MDIAVTIVMMIPVILAVALIVNVVRKNITERQPGDPVDITGAIPAVIVLMVAVLIIGSMGASIAPYSYDEDSGELTINKDVGSGAQDWDSYASDVKSLIINDNVTTVADGAFDTLTGLEYVSISDSVESITSSAFGVTLKDYLDQTITEPSAGEYVGAGDGTLYLFDDSIFTYRDYDTGVGGLTATASSAVNIVIPSERNGTKIVLIGYQAFKDKTTLARCFVLPDCNVTRINGSFSGCTGLTYCALPERLVSIQANCFNGCTSLETVSLPSTLKNLDSYSFASSALTSISIPEGVTDIGASVFNRCASLETVSLPSTVASIGASCFYACNSITSVTFASGFAAELDPLAFSSWTFYDSDGTTELDKTVAANLAGYTFQGTASALVKVLPDRSTLTAEQTLQVQELTKAALTESKTLLLDETEISSVEEKELASA